MKFWITLFAYNLALFFGPMAGFSQEPDTVEENSPNSRQLKSMREMSDYYRAQQDEQAQLPDEQASPAEINRRKAIAELEKQRIENEKKRNGLLLSRIMPFAPFIFVLALVFIINVYERKKDRERHETIRIYLEKGLEVPERLLTDKDIPQTWKPASDVRKGMIWLMVGIGISLTFFLISVSVSGLAVGILPSLAVGILPILIGLGYFLASKVSPRSAGPDNEVSR